MLDETSEAARCDTSSSVGKTSTGRVTRSAELLSHLARELREPALRVSHLDPDDASLVTMQRIQIAGRLRRLENAERVGGAGDRDVLRVAGCDLKVEAGVGAALVQLSGR